MKAAICKSYGPPSVVTVVDVEKPRPKPNEVLIKILMTTVSSADCRMRGCAFPPGTKTIGRLVLGWSGPRQPILGSEFVGIVEDVGNAVQRFKVGDEVVAFPGIKLGGHAEYRALPENAAIELKPKNLSLQQSAALGFGGSTALYYLRDRSRIKAGDDVLIIGSSGAVGSAAVQLAKYFGASVTAVCSRKNTDLVRSIGADAVVNYDSTDTYTIKQRFDIILDTTGKVDGPTHQHLLKPQGRLGLINADTKQMLRPLWSPLKDGKKVIVGPSKEKSEDFNLLVNLAAQGKYIPLVDKQFKLHSIVDAYVYVETGRKVGNVVISI